MGNAASKRKNKLGFHVTEVKLGSPGENCGLKVNDDIILTANGIILSEMESPKAVNDLVKSFENRPMMLTVYCKEEATVRDVSLTPHRNWDGDGLLGIKICLKSYEDLSGNLDDGYESIYQNARATFSIADSNNTVRSGNNILSEPAPNLLNKPNDNVTVASGGAFINSSPLRQESKTLSNRNLLNNTSSMKIGSSNNSSKNNEKDNHSSRSVGTDKDGGGYDVRPPSATTTSTTIEKKKSDIELNIITGGAVSSSNKNNSSPVKTAMTTMIAGQYSPSGSSGKINPRKVGDSSKPVSPIAVPTFTAAAASSSGSNKNISSPVVHTQAPLSPVKKIVVSPPKGGESGNEYNTVFRSLQNNSNNTTVNNGSSNTGSVKLNNSSNIKTISSSNTDSVKLSGSDSAKVMMGQ